MTPLTITCFYRNETTAMQIARIDDTPEFYLERLVLPGQHLVFEAPAEAALKIHFNAMASAILNVPTAPLIRLPRAKPSSALRQNH